MEKQHFKVGKEEELRFEVDEGWIGRIQVTSGTAELFGAPCVLNRPYDLGPGRYALFSWYGCEATLAANKRNASTFKEPTSLANNSYVKDASLSMIAIMNVHAKLEHDRESRLNPVTMIVGPNDSGKSCTARVLCTYAVRKGRSPVLVDLDPGQNDLAIPGSVACTVVTSSDISVEEGIRMGDHPLVYFFGFTTPSDAPEQYKKCVESLAVQIENRMEQDSELKHSGVIINTCGYVEGEGYSYLLSSIFRFKPSLILVMGQDLLQSKLKKDVAVLNGCEVVKMPVSGGATSRNATYRKLCRNRKIKEYFYGTNDAMPLTSSTLDLSFDQFTLLRVPGKDDGTLSSMRPVGKASELDPNMARPVDLVNAVLQNSVLGVSFASEASEVLQTNVAGFLHVQYVDAENRVMRVLSPQKGELPGKFLLLGKLKWIDE